MAHQTRDLNPGVDLHTHTMASDGTWSPRTLVETANSLNIQVLSVCDHETTANVKLTQSMAHRYGILLIPGVEMAIEHLGLVYHLLLYGFDQENEALEAMLDDTRQRLAMKKQVMAAALQAKGYKVPELGSKFYEYSTSPLYELTNALVAENPHLESDPAWDLCRTVEPSEIIGQPAAKAIEIARRAGAIPVLAHPGRGGSEISIASNEAMSGLVEMGLEGVETYYNGHHASQVARLEKFARNHKLLVSCGSDSHTPYRKPHAWNPDLCRNLLERLDVDISSAAA